MKTKNLALGTLALLLAACGGGGGGGVGAPAETPIPAAAAAVQITEANALPVSAHAAETAQDTSSSEGAVGLLAGVQVQPTRGMAGPLAQRLAQLAQGSAAIVAPLPLVAGIAVDREQACDAGGRVRVSGSVASDAGLSPGDNVQLRASACVIRIDGTTLTLDGAMSLAVTGGFLPASGNPPFRVALTLTMDGLLVREGGSSVTSTGDATLDWTQSTAGANLVVTGRAMNTRVGTRSTTLRDYRQSVTESAGTTTTHVSGTVDTDSTRLGARGGSYTLSTLADLRWDTSQPDPTAGILRVTGASGSQLRLTFGTGTVAVAVDANGDGAFERTFNTTAAELRAQL